MMVFVLAAALMSALSTSAAIAGPGDELITADNAILCLAPENLKAANEPAVAKSQTVLRGMGCLRTGSGIRAQRFEDPEVGPVWRVRFYPQGISGGLTLWALPSAFDAARTTAALKRTDK
jgi:hypothetical protein